MEAMAFNIQSAEPALTTPLVAVAVVVAPQLVEVAAVASVAMDQSVAVAAPT